MKVTIVGLGLIGGSFALDLSSQIKVTVQGVDNNPEHQKQAIELGLVERIIGAEEAINNSDVILLSVPVDTLETMVPWYLDRMKRGVLVDLGSTKHNICAKVADHPNRGLFVAAHPLAGTEFSGPKAAHSGLFRGKKNIICDHQLSNPETLDIALAIFKSLGMKTDFMSSAEHDKHMAYVSHLSHVTSFALGLTVLEIEEDEKQIFNLASTGFASTVRLAKSNPVTWSSIFNRNKEHLMEALDNYINQMQHLKLAIQNEDTEQMKALMTKANDIKRILQNDN